jgi:hypothetical protein
MWMRPQVGTAVKLAAAPAAEGSIAAKAEAAAAAATAATAAATQMAMQAEAEQTVLLMQQMTEEGAQTKLPVTAAAAAVLPGLRCTAALLQSWSHCQAAHSGERLQRSSLMSL